MIKKEQARASGSITIPIEEGNTDDIEYTLEEQEQESNELEKLIIGPKKDVLNILRMLERRLKAEIQTKGKEEVKLLSKLMSEPNPTVSNNYYHL